MLVRSMLHEVLIDLDGDFNLYVGDADGNGIIDTVQFYDNGDDMPIAAFFGRAVEERFIELGAAIYARVIAGELIANELISAFKEFEKQAEEEYAKIKEND